MGQKLTNVQFKKLTAMCAFEVIVQLLMKI